MRGYIGVIQIHVGCLDGQVATVGHRITGVEEEVHQGPLDFPGIGVNDPQALLFQDPDLNIAVEKLWVLETLSGPRIAVFRHVREYVRLTVAAPRLRS